MEAEREKLFNKAIASSDAYFKEKNFENAFREVSRASLLINNPTEQFDYLSKLITINGRSGVICSNEPKPKYDFVLIYFLTEFALDIARDLTSFPDLYGYYYRKEIQWSPDNGEHDDDWLNMSLKQLNMLQHKKAILREYIRFIYNELPVIYGIPVKYDKDSVSRIINSLNQKNTEEFWEMMSLSEELKQKDISLVPYKIHEFILKLLQEYYYMENK